MRLEDVSTTNQGSDRQRRLLVIDDEESMRRFLTMLFEAEGMQVTSADNGADGVSLLERQPSDVVVADLKMPGVDGLSVLDCLHARYPQLPVVILTAYGSERVAAEAQRRGAFRLVEKSAHNEEILQAVHDALATRRAPEIVRAERSGPRGTAPKRRIIGNSEEMHRVMQMVDKVARTEANILIFGESGTGKELIAREIHDRSPRAGGAFLSVNCGALHRDLLESTLFGHKKGSFTGAVKDQAGHFVACEGGTFFLDEVAEMAPATQVKILRALQEREIIPIGASEPVKINVRLVAATNTDLEKAVNEGRFRQDLFYRLNVIPIRIPPLRQRTDDIPPLVEHFLARNASQHGARRISREAMDALTRYDWPGNVRELENVIERAVILNEGGEIRIEDLPEKILRGPNPKSRFVIDTPVLTLEELEREYILKVLHHTGWQKKRAAEILGINASTLYRKLLGYGISGKPGVEDVDIAA